MAEEKPSTKTPGKSKKKLSTTTKVLYGVGGVAVLYVGYRLYESYQANAAANAANTAADSTATPASGDAPADIATGGTTPGAESGDPFQVVDPGSATGLTYGQEIDDLEANVGSTSGLDTELATLISQTTGTSVNPTGSTGSGLDEVPTTESAQARAALIADVAKATGLSSDVAGQQVALYLEGKPLTHAGAVNSIANQIKIGAAPTTNGTTTLPSPVLAKNVIVTPIGTPVVSPALTKAEATAAKDQGTPAEAQAVKNVTRTKAIVAKQ